MTDYGRASKPRRPLRARRECWPRGVPGDRRCAALRFLQACASSSSPGVRLSVLRALNGGGCLWTCQLGEPVFGRLPSTSRSGRRRGGDRAFRGGCQGRAPHLRGAGARRPDAASAGSSNCASGSGAESHDHSQRLVRRSASRASAFAKSRPRRSTSCIVFETRRSCV